MSIVAIVGAGTLGGSIAHTLATRDRVREIRLIDTTEQVAAGKALDIQQAGAIVPFSAIVVAHRDLHAVIGADLVVLAGPADQADSDWAEEEGVALLRQLVTLNHRAVTVCAGSSHRRLVESGVAQTAFSRQRLIGSAPYAFQFALRAVVAVELECSALDVSLTVLGIPPDHVVVPWSEATVRGAAIARNLPPARLAKLQRTAPLVWPLGPYTLAAATARLCEAIIEGTAAYGTPCYVVLDGELGIRGRAAAVTAHIGTSGVTHVAEPSLSAQERVQLDTALQKTG